MRLIPIDSTKNIVQISSQIAATSVVVIPIAQGVNPSQIDETNPAVSQYVEDGGMVRGFTNTIRAYDETGVQDSSSVIILLRKNEGNALAAPSLANMNALYSQKWKNRIFHIEQAITGSQVSGLPMGFPGIKIPKRFHKMNFDDRWELIIGNNKSNAQHICGIVTYKWYK